MELGKGDKYTKAGNPIDLGLSSQEAIKGGTKMPLRGETSEATQRPTSKSETVSSDRGSFKSKC